MEKDKRNKIGLQRIEDRAKQFSSIRKQTDEQAFDPKNPKQTFFREISQKREGVLQQRVGWRVVETTRDQEDLALQCMSLLSSDLIFPVNSFINKCQSEQNEQICLLWIQMNFQTTPASKDYHPFKKQTREIKLERFCQQQLLPLMQKFIKNKLTWNQLLKNALTSKEILQAFRKEVIEIANQHILRRSF